MSVRQLQLTFPETRVTEPVIYNMIKQFDVVPSIRRANISQHQGWMVIELSGDETAMDSAIEYARGLGVEVSPVEGDLVAG
jgi:ABC-type methionine transport system ATPase subunit